MHHSTDDYTLRDLPCQIICTLLSAIPVTFDHNTRTLLMYGKAYLTTSFVVLITSAAEAMPE